LLTIAERKITMARQKKIYTQEEVNAMTENKMKKLFNDGRIDDDMVQRWYDNKEEIEILVADAEKEFANTTNNTEVCDINETTESNTEGNSNPIKNENESEEIKMERANKLTIEATEQGYVAHFYRTHKHIADIEILTENAEHNNSLRESARATAIEKCTENGIIWNPEKQNQAWERKYNTYMTDEEVAEDTLTLVTPAIERLVEKCKYDLELLNIEVSAVTPKASNLTYIENGRYTKSGAWCCADIEVLAKVRFLDEEFEVRYNAEMKSGQLCKPKTTILEWNLMVLNEMVLNGVEIPAEEDVA
jgi:hypothetical protein